MNTELVRGILLDVFASRYKSYAVANDYLKKGTINLTGLTTCNFDVPGKTYEIDFEKRQILKVWVDGISFIKGSKK